MTSPPIHSLLLEMLRGSDPENLLRHAPTEHDWEQIVEEAATHSLIPLLYKSLKGSDIFRRLPANLADRLKRQVYAIAARSLILSSELESLLRAFEDARVPCAPLRGPALAERLYGDSTIRPMTDLDLLVQKEDLPRVETILARLGFGATERRAGFAQTFFYSLEYFTDRHGGFLVEPHWTLTYPPFLGKTDLEQVWKRCARGQVVGVNTWVLAPEDLLLHLCLHITHRGESVPLLWFYEVDRFIRQEGALDWELFLSLAHDTKVELLLSHVLKEVRALFETPIPAQVLDELAREAQRSPGARVQRLLLRTSHWDSRESLAILMAPASLRVKLRFALMLLFPSSEFMRSEYRITSRLQLGLAYFRTFCRLSWKGLRGIALLIFHRKVERMQES